MTSVFRSSRVLIFCTLLVCVFGGEIVPPPSPDVFSVAEGETRLPCQYKPSDDEDKVVQITWSKEKSDGTKEPIIVVHHTEGQKEFAEYEGRVRFESVDPMVNSALIIMNTRISDEGKYICTFATFPSGKVEAQLSLTVWSSPISNLETVTLVEGQVFGVAATCRSVAKPQAGLSWDTELPGQSQNRSLEKDISSIQFSLYPLRSMNGRKLDCLVWHPTLKTPKRHSSQLVVYYPPNAVITGYEEDWYVGLEGVTLQCDGQGNPKPENFTWTRKDGGLLEGVTVEKGVLRFNRPLSPTDTGVYECTATNQAGSGKSDLEVTVAAEKPPEPTPFDSVLVIIVGCVAVLVVIILVAVVLTVNRHYKRKNKELTIELNEKKEEISTLSRQASIRRVNSVNTDCKYQMDEIMPLRVEGTLRTSLSSLDHPRSRDSRSTLGGAVDTLGRPVIYNTSRRGRERAMEREREGERELSRLKVEAFVKSSNMSLVHSESHFLPPLQIAEPVRSRNGSAILPAEGRPQSGGGSRAGSRAGSRTGSRGHHSPMSSPNNPPLTDAAQRNPGQAFGVILGARYEGDVLDNISSATVSSQTSEARSSPFEQTSVKLWPNSKPDNILLGPETNGLHPVHNGIMHHHQPQIV
uniref:Nectin cell adhesion molecule 4a n=1 Tax=Astyanax mexicanus TaxID=7994 RepID=W5KVY3_ASTMX